MWFIGVEVEQDTSAPPPKKNPGSAPVINEEYNAQEEELMHSYYSIKLKFLVITELIFTNNSVTGPN